MKPITATSEIAEAEGRLEWLLAKLHQQSLGRRSRLRMPVLIGGTALRRAYRLTRPSTDLDFAVADERERPRRNGRRTRERVPGHRMETARAIRVREANPVTQRQGPWCDPGGEARR